MAVCDTKFRAVPCNHRSNFDVVCNAGASLAAVSHSQLRHHPRQMKQTAIQLLARGLVAAAQVTVCDNNARCNFDDQETVRDQHTAILARCLMAIAFYRLRRQQSLPFQ